MGSRSKKAWRNKKQRIYVRDNGHCHYCSALCIPFSDEDRKQVPLSATLDHIQTRATGGNNRDQNLVLACYACNHTRGCIPYSLFLNRRLWLSENKQERMKLNRLYSIGVQTMREETKNVWLLEMYLETEGEPIRHENWGVFATAKGVHSYMRAKFPDAVLNDDDEFGYIGYHFKPGHVLADVSFVANCWDLQ